MNLCVAPMCVTTSEAAARVSLKNMSFTEMEAWVEASGHKKSRAMVLWRWLYGSNKWVACAQQIQGASKEFKSFLDKAATFDTIWLKHVYTASDGTRKILFQTDDSSQETIETVVIPEKNRNTVCVSSQVGCAMNCQFCYTAKMGFRRHLSTSEILDQYIIASRLFTSHLGPLNNVVFMGMGEPLHNYGNVVKAARIMVDLHGLHLGPRKVTISTSGLVPEMRRLLREQNFCRLAVSLNATTDEVRDRLMPINKRFNIDTLLSALKKELLFSHGRQRKVLFEYVLLADVNDSSEDAERLVKLVREIPCKVNLIVFNKHDGSPFLPSPIERTLAFRNVLANSKVAVSIRKSRGDDQMAACGQLGSLKQETLPSNQLECV